MSKHIYKKGEVVKFNHKLVDAARSLLRNIMETPDSRFIVPYIVGLPALKERMEGVVASSKLFPEELVLACEKLITDVANIMLSYDVTISPVVIATDPLLDVITKKRIVGTSGFPLYTVQVKGYVDKDTFAKALPEDIQDFVSKSDYSILFACDTQCTSRGFIAKQTALLPKDAVKTIAPVKLVLDF